MKKVPEGKGIKNEDLPKGIDQMSPPCAQDRGVHPPGGLGDVILTTLCSNSTLTEVT